MLTTDNYSYSTYSLIYITYNITRVLYVDYFALARIPSWGCLLGLFPSVHNMSTNVGHRFGHPSGLDESSGRNSTTARYGYLMFPEKVKTSEINKYQLKLLFHTRNISF